MVMLEFAPPPAATPTLAPAAVPVALGDTVIVPPRPVVMSTDPEPVVDAETPVESTPATLTDVAPSWIVALPVPVPAATTPALPMPVVVAPLWTVIVLLLPKPVMLALVLVPEPRASMPTTGLVAPSSVTVIESFVEPAIEAVKPVPPVTLAIMPATLLEPSLVTVMLSLSASTADAFLVELSTSMALMAGSMDTPVPRMTVAEPLPRARMPRDPLAPMVMAMLLAAVTETAPTPVDSASMPVMPAVMFPLAWTVSVPLSLTSLISARMPVPKWVALSTTPVVTETALLAAVTVAPVTRAWTP